jgi:phage-related protein
MDYVFTWPISFDYEDDENPRVYRAAFGEGYEQNTPAGINNNPGSWNVLVQGTPDYLDAPDKFLGDRGASQAFYWTTPRGQLIRVLCRSWKRRDMTVAYGQISATFEQTFDGSPTNGFAVTSSAIVIRRK